MSDRPFGQSEYNLADIRLELPLRGLAYKFTILVPVEDREKRQIFSDLDLYDLAALLSDDLGGCTVTGEATHPLLSGLYVNQQRQTEVDHHTSVAVYAKPTPKSRDYFQELARRLVEYSRTELSQRIAGYDGEDEILLELVTVELFETFIPRREPHP